jgi:flagellar biosynthetic protein FliP
MMLAPVMPAGRLLRPAGMLAAALLLPLLFACAPAQAQDLLANVVPGARTELSVKMQILIIMTLLGLLPVMVMMMTSFTRFVIVLSLLRQALGLQQGLPNRVITGVALILTLLVMRRWATRSGAMPSCPTTRTRSASTKRSRSPSSRSRASCWPRPARPRCKQIAHLAGEDHIATPAEHGFAVKLAAFVLSELKTAFQIGCMLFIPFLIIDLVVSSVLMAMGMMMLSPLVISLPFKLLLFVLVDGWTLTVNTLVTSIQAY